MLYCLIEIFKLNKRLNKSFIRDIHCFDFLSNYFCFNFFPDNYWKRNVPSEIFIVFISFLIIFVSISFQINIGKEMSLSGFRINRGLFN